MIYAVVPEELGPELYDKLAEYYRDDPHVTVIVDRRKGDRRGGVSASSGDGERQRRERRDRRRPRVAGEFPPVESA